MCLLSRRRSRTLPISNAWFLCRINAEYKLSKVHQANWLRAEMSSEKDCEALQQGPERSNGVLPCPRQSCIALHWSRVNFASGISTNVQHAVHRGDMLRAHQQKQCNKFIDGTIEFSPLVGLWTSRQKSYKWVERHKQGIVNDPQNLFRACNRHGMPQPRNLTLGALQRGL